MEDTTSHKDIIDRLDRMECKLLTACERLTESEIEVQMLKNRKFPWLSVMTITAPIMVSVCGAGIALYSQMIEMRVSMESYRTSESAKLASIDRSLQEQQGTNRWLIEQIQKSQDSKKN